MPGLEATLGIAYAFEASGGAGWVVCDDGSAAPIV
jgi:hypothetical protein